MKIKIVLLLMLALSSLNANWIGLSLDEHLSYSSNIVVAKYKKELSYEESKYHEINQVSEFEVIENLKGELNSIVNVKTHLIQACVLPEKIFPHNEKGLFLLFLEKDEKSNEYRLIQGERSALAIKNNKLEWVKDNRNIYEGHITKKLKEVKATIAQKIALSHTILGIYKVVKHKCLKHPSGDEVCYRKPDFYEFTLSENNGSSEISFMDYTINPENKREMYEHYNFMYAMKLTKYPATLVLSDGEKFEYIDTIQFTDKNHGVRRSGYKDGVIEEVEFERIDNWRMSNDWYKKIYHENRYKIVYEKGHISKWYFHRIMKNKSAKNSKVFTYDSENLRTIYGLDSKNISLPNYDEYYREVVENLKTKGKAYFTKIVNQNEYDLILRPAMERGNKVLIKNAYLFNKWADGTIKLALNFGLSNKSRLNFSLSKAMIKAPKEVMSLIPKYFSVDELCRVPYIEESKKVELLHINRSLKALKSLPKSKTKELCITKYEALKKMITARGSYYE